MLLNVLLLLVVAIPSSVAEHQCQTALVQTLPDSNFHASSELSETTKASNVRFNVSEEPWCPSTTETTEYVTVDLGCVLPVCGVEGYGKSVLLFVINSSTDNATWKPVMSNQSQYNDPTNRRWFDNGKKAAISPPVQARYFKFELSMITDFPCFKLELYGAELSASIDSFQPIGCYKETHKHHRFMPDVYHTVKGVDKENPEISAVYEECRQKAEESPKPIKVFGIRNYNKCVTTESGAEDELDKYVKSNQCVVCLGKGIGAGTLHMFVYNKNV